MSVNKNISPSLFNIKFSCKNNFCRYTLLIDYPEKHLGYKDLCAIRKSLNNNKLEFIERSSYNLSEYVLTLSSVQIQDINAFYDVGFLYCEVNLQERFSFHKFLTFKYMYPNEEDLTYARELVSVNDILLFKEWKFQNFPHSNNDKYKYFKI